jgi:hypothetical protein
MLSKHNQTIKTVIINFQFRTPFQTFHKYNLFQMLVGLGSPNSSNLDTNKIKIKTVAFKCLLVWCDTCASTWVVQHFYTAYIFDFPEPKSIKGLYKTKYNVSGAKNVILKVYMVSFFLNKVGC